MLITEQRERNVYDFRTTHWSRVDAAARGLGDKKSEAIESLCQDYWYPLYAFLRRKGKTVEHAQDLVQNFFAELLSSERIASADARRGKFRTFLLTALANHTKNDHRDAHAKKRGGDVSTISWDGEVAEGRFLSEPADKFSPEMLYDRRWAESLFQRSLDQLRGEDEVNSPHPDRFELLKPFLLGERDQSYREVAEIMKTNIAVVKTAVCRMRQRFRATLEAEVARTVATEEEVEDELRYLFAVLCR